MFYCSYYAEMISVRIHWRFILKLNMIISILRSINISKRL